MFSSDPLLDFALFTFFETVQVFGVLFVAWAAYAAALTVINHCVEIPNEAKVMALFPSMAGVSAAVGVALYMIRLM